MEVALNRWLDSNFFAWSYRPTVRGELFNKLYNLRNSLFQIDATTKRKMIPARMINNLNALDYILSDASRLGIRVLIYIPPIRRDAPLPYDSLEYESFKQTIQARAATTGVKFINLEALVPGSLWGLKEATNTSGKKELDYMHFQNGGHILVANALLPLISKQQK
ncbi:MAG: hypothetical protein EOP48_07205 [Sphingobacteriales bacterium]|nr:MAG: hypothetical protein EOP48_07205 [Sphingobacteriales bacterium]